MKPLIILTSLFLGIIFINPVSTSAQSCCGKSKSSCKTSRTGTQSTSVDAAIKDSLHVSGACGMCKTRIESAAKGVKGVKSAVWNSESSLLVFTHDGNVKKEDISNAITAVGHDTELGKAPDEVYNSLPACCKYR